MRTVDIQQLGARLREHLRAVREGETLRVMDGDEMIAELGPVRWATGPTPGVEDRLRALAESGQLERARRPREGWHWASRGAQVPSHVMDALPDDLRADR